MSYLMIKRQHGEQCDLKISYSYITVDGYTAFGMEWSDNVGKETKGWFVTHYLHMPKHCEIQAKLVIHPHHSYIAGA